MKIFVFKTFTDPKSGLTLFAGSSVDVDHDLAVAAVVAGATDDADALRLAEERGALRDADKAIEKMRKEDLVAEVRRLRAGSPDIELQANLDVAKAEFKSLEFAADKAVAKVQAELDAATEKLTAMHEKFKMADGVVTTVTAELNEVTEKLTAAEARLVELDALLVELGVATIADLKAALSEPATPNKG